MAVINCKMCGGDLRIIPGENIAICEYCGTKQTVPTVDNEKKLTLYNRANRLRLRGEFDTAAGVYEAIVADFPKEAEAYWGLVLCSYGIEYVDDPLTGKKIPTCHRSSFDSILSDTNVAMACDCADVLACKLYREEARRIEEIRRDIIEVSGKEKPYDIFICYKETDENGQRTLDSVLAQDVYDALTARGYRVFFSRITLEDKLGREYEPYIFAALTSARIMLVFGTKDSHFNAVWVKNEWRRFLRLMGQDRSRHLIPCYQNLDAYDLPEEFAKLQAQDLGKLGAVQDLLRGIEKLLPKNSPQETAGYRNIDANIANLLMQGNVDLSIGEWEPAAKIFTKALTMDSHCAEAYLGRCLAQHRAENLEDLEKRLTYDRKTVKEAVLSPVDIAQKEKQLHSRYRDAQIHYPGKREYKSIAAGIRQQQTAALQIFKSGGDLIQAELYGDSAMKQRISALRNRVKGSYDLALRNAELTDDKEKTAIQKAVDEYFTQREKEIKAEIAQKEQQRQEALRRQKEQEEAARQAEKAKKVQEEADRHRAEAERKRAEAEAAQKQAALRAQLPQIRERISPVQGKISGHAVVDSLGQAWYQGENDKLNAEISLNWLDIATVSSGTEGVIGLRYDGTVVAAGNIGKVSSWKDMVAVATGGYHALGLRADGTVFAAGNNQKGQCNVAHWQNVKAIAAGPDISFALLENGDILEQGTFAEKGNRISGENAVAIAAMGNNLIYLRADGTASTAYGMDEMKQWGGIVAIAGGAGHAVGLKTDGTVVACADSYYGNPVRYKGQCDVSKWDSIVAIAAGYDFTVGLKADGTMVATKDRYSSNSSMGSVERYTKRAVILQKIGTLQAQLSKLGLFASSQKKELRNQIDQLHTELKKL